MNGRFQLVPISISSCRHEGMGRRLGLRLLIVSLFLWGTGPTLASDPPVAAQPQTTTEPPAAGPAAPPGGQPPSNPSPSNPSPSNPPAAVQRPDVTSPNDPPPPGATDKLVRLDPKAEVWIDAKRQRVIVGGSICLREGQLEMFACPKGTKEHESIVAVQSRAYLIHTALLAIGARAGNPVQYDPVYKPASGMKIKVEVLWRDADGKAVRQNAQELIRHTRTKQSLEHAWVFAGSSFWQDEKTNERFYQAEGGELICLSNFSTATLDLPVESPQDNADLLYEAWTERIPPLGTRVKLILSIEP